MTDQINKRILILIIPILLTNMILHVDGSYMMGSHDDQLDQQQMDYQWISKLPNDESMFAQSFTPTLGILSFIELYIMYTDECSIEISIRKNLSGQTLASSTFTPGFDNTRWIPFDFPDIGVTPGEKYYIIWNPEDGCALNSGWGRDDGYDHGESWMYTPDEGWNSYIGDFAFLTYGRKTKPNPPTISGPTEVTLNHYYQFNFSAIDIDDNLLSYYIEWGDGNSEQWIGSEQSGEVITCSHTWRTGGMFQVRAKVRDEWGVESNWSEPYNVYVCSPSFEIRNINSGFARISAEICNCGDAIAPTLNWSMNIDIDNNMINPYTEGKINDLDVGETRLIQSRFLFGYGDFVVTISVNGASESKKGFCLGPLIMFEDQSKLYQILS